MNASSATMEDDLTVAAGAEVKYCLKLAGDDWFLRGIEVVREPPMLDVAVAKAPLEELAVTALLVLTYLRDGPTDLEVNAELVGDQVEITVAARAGDPTTAFAPVSAYRKLTRADLALIADVHGVGRSIVVGDRVTLRFPATATPSTTRTE